MKKIRVLQIVPSLSQANGVASYAMNYYRNLKKIEMDFALTTTNTESEYYKEIENNGNIIYDLSTENSKNIFEYISKIKSFFQKHSKEYDIIHCNVANSGVFFLYYAKKYGIKTRILHSHGTSTGENILKRIRNNFILIFSKMLSNEYFACSEAAGKAMFKNYRFIVINNAIEGAKYEFNKQYREEIREEFNVGDSILIGTIGRLNTVKNQEFMLNIMKQLENNKYKLMLVGNGPLEKALKEKAKELGIEDKVIFTGSRNDTYKIYSAFDIFILSSLFEGLPVVGVEAQCNGLTCIFADTITTETKINSNVSFLSITNPSNWIEKIKEIDFKRIENNNFSDSTYNIKKESIKLEEKYINLNKKI